MKNTFTKLLSLALALVLCLGMFAACGGDKGGDDDINTDEPDDLLGITDDTIWVGNTAGTTGALAAIGGPFNYGIQAAFAAYNQAGGYNGKSIKLNVSLLYNVYVIELKSHILCLYFVTLYRYCINYA